MNTKIIKLDINKKMFETITAKQGDTKSRFILFNLYDGPIQFDLTGRTVRVYGEKKDNTTIFNDLVITDAKKGYCTLELTNQMLAVEGMSELELVIFEGEKRLSTMPFILNVVGSKYSEDAIASTNEFTALSNALKTVGEIDNKADKKEVEKISSQLDKIEKRIDYLYVEDFGAKGDGLTDDTLFFQNAIDYCSSNNIQLYLKSKKYLVNSTLQLKSNLHIEGTFGSEIYMPSSTIMKDIFSHSQTIRIKNLTIKNIKLSSVNDKTDTAGYGVLSNVQGIVLNNCENILFQNIETDSLTTSFKIVNSNNNGDFTDYNKNIIIDNFICLNNGTSCYITSTKNLTLNNCIFEQSNTVTSNRHCIYIKEDVDDINIDKCKIKNAKGSGIHLYILPGDVSLGKRVNNINITNTTISDCLIALNINYSDNININNIKINNVDYIVSLDDSNNILFDNCNCKCNISVFAKCFNSGIKIKNSLINCVDINNGKIIDNGGDLRESKIDILNSTFENIKNKILTSSSNTENLKIKMCGCDFNFSAYWGSGGAFTINNELITFILQSCNIENCSETVFPYLYYSYVNDINKNVIIKDNIIKGNITLFRPTEQETDGYGVLINNFI